MNPSIRWPSSLSSLRLCSFPTIFSLLFIRHHFISRSFVAISYLYFIVSFFSPFTIPISSPPFLLCHFFVSIHFSPYHFCPVLRAVSRLPFLHPFLFISIASAPFLSWHSFIASTPSLMLRCLFCTSGFQPHFLVGICSSLFLRPQFFVPVFSSAIFVPIFSALCLSFGYLFFVVISSSASLPWNPLVIISSSPILHCNSFVPNSLLLYPWPHSCFTISSSPFFIAIALSTFPVTFPCCRAFVTDSQLAFSSSHCSCLQFLSPFLGSDFWEQFPPRVIFDIISLWAIPHNRFFVLIYFSPRYLPRSLTPFHQCYFLVAVSSPPFVSPHFFVAIFPCPIVVDVISQPSLMHHFFLLIRFLPICSNISVIILFWPIPGSNFFVSISWSPYVGLHIFVAIDLSSLLYIHLFLAISSSPFLLDISSLPFLLSIIRCFLFSTFLRLHHSFSFLTFLFLSLSLYHIFITISWISFLSRYFFVAIFSSPFLRRNFRFVAFSIWSPCFCLFVFFSSLFPRSPSVIRLFCGVIYGSEMGMVNGQSAVWYSPTLLSICHKSAFSL